MKEEKLFNTKQKWVKEEQNIKCSQNCNEINRKCNRKISKEKWSVKKTKKVYRIKNK